MTENGAIWRDQLTAGRASRPGPGHDGVPARRPDVLVIGGGILGVSIAGVR